MKILTPEIRRLTAVLCLLFLIGPEARAAEPDVIAVAVLDFDAKDPAQKERAAQLSLLISTALSNTDGVATVERQELAKLLGEQELGASGMVEPATAARIGHLTGARVLVTGRVFTIAGETTAALKVMSTETSRVFGATETFAVDAPPAAPAEKLAAKVAEILQTRKAALIVQTVSPEDRVAQLKAKLAGRTLPSVAISIPEQHFGRPVIDPAAETEIRLILGRSGFTVLTGDAAARADVTINGEAISEAGIRRGGLISCRARIEINAVGRDGKVMLTDRQTTWAVDTAEHIAAKLALQHGGAELATRLAEAIAMPN